MKIKRQPTHPKMLATEEIKQLLAPWSFASLNTSIKDLDEALYDFLLGFNAKDPHYIRDEIYLHLVMLKGVKEIDRIFSRYRGWRSMNFTVQTYFMVFACEISVPAISRMNFLLSLHPDDLAHVVDMLRFYIETKRIEAGVPRDEYEVR